jgi:hypothetical protein
MSSGGLAEHDGVSNLSLQVRVEMNFFVRAFEYMTRVQNVLGLFPTWHHRLAPDKNKSRQVDPLYGILRTEKAKNRSTV